MTGEAIVQMAKDNRKPGQIDVIDFGISQYEISVASVIRAAFPRGTRLRRGLIPRTDGKAKFDLTFWSGEDEGAPLSSNDWKVAPALPPDIFAVCGLLLEMSGAAHHVVTETPDDWARRIAISELDMGAIRKAAKEWRDRGVKNGIAVCPSYVQKQWNVLWSDAERRKKVFVLLPPDSPAPEWWSSALRLLICADEAAFGYGFQRLGSPKAALESFYEYYLATSASDAIVPPPADLKPLDGRYTLSTVPADIACVLPKSRTAQVGCTLRSLSHHLALLPPRGKARAIWHTTSRNRFKVLSDAEPLNLLLIPHPFQIPVSSFSPIGELQNERSPDRWGWFKIEQAWQPLTKGPRPAEDSGAILQLVRRLAKEARDKAGHVHGIVFPEAALTQNTFDRLRGAIQDATRDDDPLASVDFLISGLRSVGHGRDERRGNFAAACLISRPTLVESRTASRLVRFTRSGIQEKHHRWRLDPSQINSYGLGSHLTAGVTWWEGVPLLSRSLNVFVFRSGSTLVPLICEDLARLEPVHELVRAIGPNLVIALLMDGPQVSKRWPGRYAMGLADDPGSSVLTLTSLGLVTRASERATEEHKSRSVGLWRDQTGDTRQLQLDGGASAILLSLSGQRTIERTIDGRNDNASARVWIYSDHCSVTLSKPPRWAT